MGLLDGILPGGLPGLFANIENLRGQIKRRGLLDLPNIMGEHVAQNIAGPGLLAAEHSRSVVPEVREPARQKMTDTALGLLAVVRPAVANRLKFSTSLPSSPEFSQAVANTPGASVTADGLLMRVMRNQRPEQGLSESVRGGVFYLPEGAAQAKYYTTGKNGYGGSERIKGETLIKNPVFAKGGTGGKAPESAYDSLLGKGSYQQMRREALNVNYGRLTSHPDKGPSADDFLSKYAPELSGMGDYILQNSKQSNQLAYALQEAAVASALRRAGHDAVVGYSKGKAGPFLSEVFDVRESHYPDKFGGFRVWDDLYAN